MQAYISRQVVGRAVVAIQKHYSNKYGENHTQTSEKPPKPGRHLWMNGDVFNKVKKIKKHTNGIRPHRRKRIGMIMREQGMKQNGHAGKQYGKWKQKLQDKAEPTPKHFLNMQIKIETQT